MALNKVLGVLDATNEWIGKIFSWIIVPLTLLVGYEVISRRIFNSPHVWAPEITTLLYGAHFMLVASYTLLHSGHVRVDLIYVRFRPRVRAILDIVTYSVFFFPFCIIVLINGFVFAKTSWVLHETSGSAALPIIPELKTVIPLTALLLLIQGLSEFIRCWITAIKGIEK